MTSIPTRRQIIQGIGLTLLPLPALAQSSTITLKAMKGEVALLGADKPKTAIWGYEGQVPAPVIRVKQGEKLSVKLENQLDVDTTIHWHGVRLPNAMDGAGGMTQPPVKKGESFLYEFTPQDAGTFWFHPHVHGNTSEQLDRGLYGALIVEEKTPPAVDRELIVFLDDWSLTDKGQIVESFGNRHDALHAGRIGNLLLANNTSPLKLDVKRHERIRMRLINSATSKIFWLKFQNMKPTMVAFDGQPSEPIELKEEQIVLAPGQRADLIFDITHGIDEIRSISDFDGRNTVKLMELTASKEPPVREKALTTPLILPENPLPASINLSRAMRYTMVLDGGMNPRKMQHGGSAGWTINGVSSHGHDAKPFFSVRKGTVVVITFKNETAFPHAMHIHGHSFRLLDPKDDGWKPYWLDSVLAMPTENTQIAFVADNPGKWMLHCHMIEHQEAGMATWFEVK